MYCWLPASLKALDTTVMNHVPTRSRAGAAIRNVKVVSFDLDDTFWDCAPAIIRAEQVLYEWLQVVTPRITAIHDQQSLIDYRTRFRNAHPQYEGCVTTMRVRGLQALLSEFGYDESLCEEGFAQFLKARSQVQLYPGVVDLLTAVSERYQIAAITNGNADLTAVGIDRFFNRIYAADMELKAKPAVDMFDQCCDHFDIAPENMLHIGDNRLSDIKGALNAGAQSLWFNQHRLHWPQDEDPPHFQACSIAEIRSLLTGS
jgi:putative hydrolase of the HAD superfamily